MELQEDIRALEERLRDYTRSVAQPVAPQLAERIEKAKRKYEQKRDEVIMAYESGKIKVEEFCDRFSSEVSPLAEKVRSLYQEYDAAVEWKRLSGSESLGIL